MQLQSTNDLLAADHVISLRCDLSLSGISKGLRRPSYLVCRACHVMISKSSFTSDHRTSGKCLRHAHAPSHVRTRKQTQTHTYANTVYVEPVDAKTRCLQCKTLHRYSIYI